MLSVSDDLVDSDDVGVVLASPHKRLQHVDLAEHLVYLGLGEFVALEDLYGSLRSCD